MKYIQFKIENFRGIKDIVFDTAIKPESKIFTLVGLNESGKTTLLEALAYWYENIGEAGENPLHTTGISDPHSLIPRAEQFNFNRHISIQATLKFEESDKPILDKLFRRYGYQIVWEQSSDIITRKLQYQFANSKLKTGGTNRYLGQEIKIKKVKGSKKVVAFTNTTNAELWKEFGNVALGRMRPIIYYPNFLFEFPERIYIDSPASPDARQNFYYRFLQDILDSIDESLSIKSSLLDRYEAEDQNSQRALQSTVNRMSSGLDSLMKSLDLFNFKSSNRRVVVTGPFVESAKHYLQVQVQDGDDTYDIRERSLGFRWFFTFALLTQFRVKRSNSLGPIFVFDEPASNLHQTAQQRLLKALENLTNSSDSIVIYATHSHHLISPSRLEATYIVRNEALSIEDEGDYRESMTDIKIYKYRNFVHQFPNDKDYFQPILDILEYRPSDLENVPNAVIVEGKNDFYTFKFIEKKLKKKFSIIPGFGVDNLATIIALYIGWGKSFVVLLDSDKAGKDKKAKYVKNFGPIMEGRVFTLGDISSSWSGFALESLFTENERINIQKKSFPESVDYDKSKFNTALQEALINDIDLTMSKGTKDGFSRVFKFLEENLSLDNQT